MTTAISWTNETWNPVTGCSHVSEGCRFCYAERISLKMGWSPKPWTKENAALNVHLHPERLRKPYSYKRPSMVFVNSMSDLFHEIVPDDFVAKIFAVMVDLPQHTFQILTKRPERAATWPGPWTKNIWMGTSIESPRWLTRVDALRHCGAAMRFISFEPLLERMGPVDLHGIGWAIVGGESGRHFRPMDMAWARELRDQCVAQDVAFFYKQDCGRVTELRPWIVEEDGSRWEWHQWPGNRAKPKRVEVQHSRTAQARLL